MVREKYSRVAVATSAFPRQIRRNREKSGVEKVNATRRRFVYAHRAKRRCGRWRAGRAREGGRIARISEETEGENRRADKQAFLIFREQRSQTESKKLERDPLPSLNSEDRSFS